MYTSFNGPKYATTAVGTRAIRDALNRVRSVPGVEAAGAAGYAPLQGNIGLNFNIAGRAPLGGTDTGHGGWVPVSPGYFDVFKIPLKRGRVFTDNDDGQSLPVVLINESMAKLFWKDGDPLNDRIVIGAGIGKGYADGQVRQIVGIVGDVRQKALSEAPQP